MLLCSVPPAVGDDFFFGRSNVRHIRRRRVSQILLENPKGPVKQGNLNTCVEGKLCLFFIYSGSVQIDSSKNISPQTDGQRPLSLTIKNIFTKFTELNRITKTRLPYFTNFKTTPVLKLNNLFGT